MTSTSSFNATGLKQSLCTHSPLQQQGFSRDLNSVQLTFLFIKEKRAFYFLFLFRDALWFQSRTCLLDIKKRTLVLLF